MGKIRQYARCRPSRVPGQMNNLEREYSEYLQKRLLAGEILHWEYEPYKIKIAPKCFLQVDFFVLTSELRPEFHECKGFMEEDANVKLKEVAHRHWWFRFLLVKKRAKKNGGGFEITEFGV